ANGPVGRKRRVISVGRPGEVADSAAEAHRPSAASDTAGITQTARGLTTCAARRLGQRTCTRERSLRTYSGTLRNPAMKRLLFIAVLFLPLAVRAEDRRIEAVRIDAGSPGGAALAPQSDPGQVDRPDSRAPVLHATEDRSG